MTIRYGLGIDLGTTQTAAAVRVDGRIEVVRLGGRRPEIPSLIFVKSDGGLLIGEAAERRGGAEPGRLAREFKRRIGDPVPILVGGAPFSAHALTAKLLRHVLDAVEQLQGGPPSAVTLTHPANWGPYKREQLDQAIRLADAGHIMLRTEPEAAALQHATARKIAPGETVAVYDLGGGTFDAAVLRRDTDGFVLLGEPEGVEQLGGADFDEAVFGHVVQTLGSMIEGLDLDEPEVVTALSRLRRDCVEAKESLSFDTEAMIPVALPGLHTRVRLNRSELEAMIAPSLADSVAAMHRALRSAGVGPEQISAVLLAGGSSRIPLVAQLLSTALGRPVVADPHPEHSIAMGAAVATAAVTGGVSPFAAAVAPPASAPPASAPPASAPPASAPPASAPPAPAPPAPAPPASAPPASTRQTSAPAVGGRAGVQAGGSLPGGSGAGGAPSRATATAQSGAAGASGGNGTAYPGPTGANATVYPGSATSNPGPMSSPAGTADGGSPTGAAVAVPPANGAATAGAAPVSFSRGAASVQGANGSTPPGTTFGSPAGVPKRGPTRLLIVLSAILVVLLAGGAAFTVVLLRNKNNNKNTAGGPTAGSTAPASQAASQAATPPFSTKTMLVRVDTGGDAGPSVKSAIYLLTPGSDERTKIIDTGGDTLPEWSHKRDQIAETRTAAGNNHEIWVVDATGGNPRKIIGDVTGGRVAWSADDTKLAFVKLVDNVPQLFVITLGESTPRQLTSQNSAKDDPAWSPDGKSIVYWVSVNNVRQLFLLDVADPVEPGKQLTKGSSGPGVDPAWSPDGTKIAYTHGTGPGLSDIWLINVDGTGGHAVAKDPAREMDPTFAPEGTWIALTRGDLSRPKVVIINLAGTEEHTLTKGTAREGHPCWS